MQYYVDLILLNDSGGRSGAKDERNSAMRHDANREPHPAIKTLYKIVEQMMESGESEAAMNAVIRSYLQRLAAGGEGDEPASGTSYRSQQRQNFN